MSVDYPRAWQIARLVPFEQHGESCSYLREEGALLCDCHVVNKHPDMLRKKLISVRTWVYTFRPQFVEAVRDKKKCRTIRPERKDGKRPQLGDHVSLREWTDLPYRSPQRVLRTGVVTRVAEVLISEHGCLHVDGLLFTLFDLQRFAEDDGFASPHEMLAFFRKEHSLPFSGVLIAWSPYDCTPTQPKRK